MPERCLILPTAEPLDLAAVKQHLRETSNAQDLMIEMFLGSARESAEHKTRQQLLHARWELTLDTFPFAGAGTSLPFADAVNIPPYAIILPHAPCAAVKSIVYTAMDGTQQTMDAADYIVNTAMMPAIVTPRFGKIWPIPLPQIGSVVVTYDAGYASPVTADHTDSSITVSGPVTWDVGAVVRFQNSGGALPAPLKENTDYQIASVESEGIYTLKDRAGDTVTLTDDGTGSNYIAGVPRGPIPKAILNWMMVRTGSLYQNREEMALLSRGQINELPYMEHVLDAHRVSLGW